MAELEAVREQINKIDKEMAVLFESRMNCCAEIAAFKQRNGMAIRDTAREAQLIEKNLSYIESDAIKIYYKEFIEKILELSRDWQLSLNLGSNLPALEENSDKDGQL